MHLPNAPHIARRQVLVWGAAGCLAGRAGGATAQGLPEAPPLSTPPAPGFVASAIGSARLAGTSLFKYWGFEVYLASLWVTPAFKATTYWQSPFALELNYLRTLEGRAIAQRSLEEMQRAGNLAPELATAWLASMAQIFPNVNKGDTLTGLHLPERGARFLVNGQPLGEITHADYSRRFFGIWLGASTSAPGLRAALLKGAPS
ncbi:MAG: hypothetical protein RLZZ591_1727 [Pseudomonadota bacterium]